VLSDPGPESVNDFGIRAGSGQSFEQAIRQKALPIFKIMPPFSRIAWCLGSALYTYAAFKVSKEKDGLLEAPGV